MTDSEGKRAKIAAKEQERIYLKQKEEAQAQEKARIKASNRYSY